MKAIESADETELAVGYFLRLGNLEASVRNASRLLRRVSRPRDRFVIVIKADELAVGKPLASLKRTMTKPVGKSG